MLSVGIQIAIALAILATWVVIRVRAWARASDDGRAKLPSHLLAVLRAEWPLLVILLLPALLEIIADLAASVMLALLGVLLLWWVADAVGYLVVRPDPVRDPLVCAVVAMRRLARSPLLIGVLVVLWLALWATGAFHNRRWLDQAEQRSEARSEIPAISAHRPPAQRSVESRRVIGVVGGGHFMAPARLPDIPDLRHGSALDRLVRTYLVRHLPRERLPLPANLTDVLALLAVAVLFARLRFAGKPEERDRAAWPFRLTVLLLLLGVVPWYVTVRGLRMGQLYGAHSIWWVGASLGFVLGAPYAALAWQILRQVTLGRRWDVEEATRVASNSWVPFVGFLLVAMLPTLLLITIPGVLMELALSTLTQGQSIRVYTVLSALGHLPAIGAQLSVPFGLALVLVPWLLADRRSGLREALPEGWRLARRRARDVLVFTLRYLMLFAVAGWSIGLIPVDRPPLDFTAGGLARGVLDPALWLLSVVVIGVLYGHLKDARAGASAGS